MRYSPLLLSCVVWVMTTCTSDSLDRDEQPELLGMTITGIPDSDITIDQVRHEISVFLPSTLSDSIIKPQFRLSRRTHLAKELAINVNNYCPCDKNNDGSFGKPFQTLFHITNDNSTIPYTITLNSKGALTFKSISNPVTIKAGTQVIYLPVENYYGSRPILRIDVVPVGKPFTGGFGSGADCFNTCQGKLNQIGISLSAYEGTAALKPGLYDIELHSVINGQSQITRSPQPFVVN